MSAAWASYDILLGALWSSVGIGMKDVSHQASDFYGDWAKKVPCRNATSRRAATSATFSKVPCRR